MFDMLAITCRTYTEYDECYFVIGVASNELREAAGFIKH